MFSDFVKRAIKQDSRNQFDSFDGDISFIPDALQDFYKNSNPADVEVKIQDNYVRFIPVWELEKIQKLYALGEACFVFASCEDEPIYLKNKKVYTCLYGKNGIKEEVLADSLSEYLNKIDC